MKSSSTHASTGIRIRKAKPREFLAIAVLDRVAWRQNRHGRFIPDGEHAWRVWCEQALTFVACRDSQVIGAIMAFPCITGAYWLHKVMVAERCRGLGIATRLMQALLQAVDRRGADISLTVDPANQPALRLYGKWGFTARKLVRGFYRGNEDRYVLTRQGRKDQNQ